MDSLTIAFYRLDASSSAGKRKWAIDQLSGIVRSGEIPRSDAWISAALHFFLVHGFFLVKKKNKDSEIELVSRHSLLLSGSNYYRPIDTHDLYRCEELLRRAFQTKFMLPVGNSSTLASHFF